mmetsp:Transcript_2689/g.3890  ORF Transcript_2689/g.3890 Transcript_2689/m.3890 type:complete len:212 (-) Transcript_2689:133-768(-)|eukprot:CAMPEP_0167744170 /NCGR_PEP_ID=MMETSP0110_2-20121227/2435_1 /TAXON_ID=629695 /ORGANISM="Gymnochlora sp., Strain CCMP2014" /LENGTH=211 /DNA_ID=CAMNT_0007628647 /DNA_START=200 /DNA_END=835 /DNA_ORIENTATION=+
MRISGHMLVALGTMGVVMFLALSGRSQGLGSVVSTRGAAMQRVAMTRSRLPFFESSRDVVVNSAAVEAPVRREALTTAKGGRKRAHAKCAVFQEGSGKLVINGKDANEYFKHNLVAYMELYQLMYLLGLHQNNDVHFQVEGGGITGQKDAIKLAAARLLLKEDFPLSTSLPRDQLKAMFREKGWLTRDARKKERKKYGLKKARKAPQFSKR